MARRQNPVVVCSDPGRSVERLIVLYHTARSSRQMGVHSASARARLWAVGCGLHAHKLLHIVTHCYTNHQQIHTILADTNNPY
jgi:hypothetical protein